ncbi:polyprenyl synthetase family protein [Rhodococcus sp. X156]|uniref:polyprenyl synthetase family protein n=1 Tax=Rhodococcus sp. X156 TaxID=2499145 RepID=UPI001F49C508|nr:polyprenyl synthetase family protein [Rhodococcus sp. X156]
MSATEQGFAGQYRVAGVDLGDPALAEAVQGGLDAVEELLTTELSTGDLFITEKALHLVRAGGKRFRPLFTLLAAQLGPDAGSPDVVTAGGVVELIHLATLYHDDVMDEATMRRGAVSANARWDNSIAILAGDFLFAHASRLVARLGPDAVRIIAETFAELATGQMRETVGLAEGQDPVQHYLRVVAEKTGSLIATCGRYGGMFSGADDEQVERLHRLGEAVGTAFQISDDIIDIASDSTESGKTPGTDLREGVHTLPVLLALTESGPDAERLRVLLDGPVTDDADVNEALELLSRSAGLVAAKATLGRYADAAHAELAALPQGPANTALRRLVDYTVARTG